MVGAIGVAYRRGFERCYDLMERVLPPPSLAAPTPGRADAQRALTALAARSHGIGTVGDSPTTTGLSVRQHPDALADLVEAGEVIPGPGARLEGAGVPATRRPDRRGGSPVPHCSARSIR